MSFFLNATATTEIYTLSLHDALPIYRGRGLPLHLGLSRAARQPDATSLPLIVLVLRSEEHTSELQSRRDLVCRLLLEKKKNIDKHRLTYTPTTHAHPYPPAEH